MWESAIHHWLNLLSEILFVRRNGAVSSRRSYQLQLFYSYIRHSLHTIINKE